jgi:hypothetical protein
MSAMPIASRPLSLSKGRCTFAAVFLAAGGAVASLPAPAAAQNAPAAPYSDQGTQPVAPNASPVSHPDKQSLNSSPQRRHSIPRPARHPSYPQSGQEAYYCSYYPVNCAQPLPYPFYSYPPSYYISPSYGYAQPYYGEAGFGAAIGPVFGFGPGIILPRRFVIRRRIRVHRVIRPGNLR